MGMEKSWKVLEFCQRQVITLNSVAQVIAKVAGTPYFNMYFIM